MAKWIDRVAGETCPRFVFDIGPVLDEETKTFRQITEDDFKITGCRGITCEQCWNQESEEE